MHDISRDKTLVMDTDYIVSNDLFAKAFESTRFNDVQSKC